MPLYVRQPQWRPGTPPMWPGTPGVAPGMQTGSRLLPITVWQPQTVWVDPQTYVNVQRANAARAVAANAASAAYSLLQQGRNPSAMQTNRKGPLPPVTLDHISGRSSWSASAGTASTTAEQVPEKAAGSLGWLKPFGSKKAKNDNLSSAEALAKRNRYWKKAAISAGVAAGLGILGSFIGKTQNQKLVLSGLILQGIGALGAIFLPGKYYDEASRIDKVGMGMQFLRGALLTVIFAKPGIKATFRLLGRMIGVVPKSPLAVEHVLQTIKDNFLTVAMSIGFSDLMGSFNFTRERR